jgi:hypothetical protein
MYAALSLAGSLLTGIGVGMCVVTPGPMAFLWGLVAAMGAIASVRATEH